MTHDDSLSHFEYGAEPFTAVELEAIMAYREEVDGIPDALDMTAESLKEGQPTVVRALLGESAGALNHWYLTLGKALAELLTCTAESTGYSTAAARFLKSSAEEYHHARQRFEYTVTVFSLGLDNSPQGDYPQATSRLNLAMQSLEGGEL
ncbi:hypothetical protein ABT169_17720 [Streptomyces sp. NPDC001616]|uniref:hypothetical protein n=1 Tax=Streptomyces sp. NPDC001616 TaxID=3156648 RepID=UPI0033280959